MQQPTGPLGRIETIKLLLAAAEEHNLPWPASVGTDETGGLDGSIPVIHLRFDSSEQMQPWAEFFQVEPSWRHEQLIAERTVRLFNSTAFNWNGWKQVALTASEPIETAAQS